MACMCRSTRRLSLRTLLRDATVMLAGTVLGILLSQVFFSERGERFDMASLCGGGETGGAGGMNSMPHLTKRGGAVSLKQMRSRRLFPRPLPAMWGSVANRRTDVYEPSPASGDLDRQPAQQLEHGQRVTDSLSAGSGSADSQPTSDILATEDEPHPPTRQSLLVGVSLMHPNSREGEEGKMAVARTWGTRAPNLIFFSSSELERGPQDDPPVVTLPGNHDDNLRPHRSAYHMLKYIHDNFIDSTDWFVLTDDRVYLRIERLSRYLDKLDPNQEQCISHSVSGTQVDIKLDYQGEPKFSLGGPGRIFSRALLKKLVPSLDKCLRNSTAMKGDAGMEDVERCVQLIANSQCRKNNEVVELLMSDRLKDDIISHASLNPYTNELLHTALSIRPIREPKLMYRLHQFYVESDIDNLRERTVHLLSELEALSSIADSS